MTEKQRRDIEREVARVEMVRDCCLIAILAAIVLVLGVGCMSTSTRISRTASGVKLASPKDVTIARLMYSDVGGNVTLELTGYSSAANVSALTAQAGLLTGVVNAAVSAAVSGASKGVR